MTARRGNNAVHGAVCALAAEVVVVLVAALTVGLWVAWT